MTPSAFENFPNAVMCVGQVSPEELRPGYLVRCIGEQAGDYSPCDRRGYTEPVNRCETPIAQRPQMAMGASSGRLIQKTSGILGAWGGRRNRPGMAA